MLNGVVIHMTDIGLIEETLNVELAQLLLELVTFESKGLSIQSIVVMLSHLIFDSINVLAVVEILEDATYLIIGVDFTLLVEWFGYIYRIENTRTMMSEYVK